MAKSESSFTNMLLALTGISLFAAVALASVYAATKAPIEASQTAEQQRAIKEVLPAYERLDAPEPVEVGGVGTLELYKAYDRDDHFVGAAIKSFSKNGFSGEIKIIVGFDEKGNIINYSVLEQKETPGLGTKMVDWFKPAVHAKKSLIERITGYEAQSKERKSSIVGKNPATDSLTVSRDGGDIDAITAATVSSRAFLEAVRYAYAAYVDNPDAPDVISGATTPADAAGATSSGNGN
jgi:electron transport complex protein RnfG